MSVSCMGATRSPCRLYKGRSRVPPSREPHPNHTASGGACGAECARRAREPGGYNPGMDWRGLYARERSRYEDGVRRLAPGQLVRVGNAAYGAGLALLMLGRGEEAMVWLERAGARWRESVAAAGPTAWGRPVGALKAALLAGRHDQAAAFAGWTLGLRAAEADSPIGRYAATLALLVLARDGEARTLAATLQDRDDFPADVAAALVALAARDEAAYAAAAESVLRSFETRSAYLEDAPVADTVLALQALAAGRGIAAALRPSALLPAGG